MSQFHTASRRFGDLTDLEIRECARQDWLVVIPTGCTEQQGPHLPVDFDTWFAETLMVAVVICHHVVACCKHFDHRSY